MTNIYDEIVHMYKDHPDYAEMGIFAGYGEHDESDHLPRCDCGRLFEICNYPNCQCATHTPNMRTDR